MCWIGFVSVQTMGQSLPCARMQMYDHMQTHSNIICSIRRESQAAMYNCTHTGTQLVVAKFRATQSKPNHYYWSIIIQIYHSFRLYRLHGSKWTMTIRPSRKRRSSQFKHKLYWIIVIVINRKRNYVIVFRTTIIGNGFFISNRSNPPIEVSSNVFSFSFRFGWLN